MGESSVPQSSQSSSETRRLLSAALIIGLVAAVLALLVFSWLGREVVTGVTPAMDERLRAAVYGYASPGLTRFMIAVSRFGGPSWLVPMGITLALQNHAPVITPGYEDALTMLQEIDRRNVRLCLDVPLF